MKKMILALLVTCCFTYCGFRAEERKEHVSGFPPGIDSAMYVQANSNPEERTFMREMMAGRIKPGGYFFGISGVLPNGDIAMEMIWDSPLLSDSGWAKVYYRYLQDRTAVKTDTFRIFFGVRDPK